MANITVIIICVLCVVFGGLSFYLAVTERRERKEQEKYAQEVKDNAEKAADATTEANKTKADARTGNRERDLNYMAQRLHEYAQK